MKDGGGDSRAGPTFGTVIGNTSLTMADVPHGIFTSSAWANGLSVDKNGVIGAGNTNLGHSGMSGLPVFANPHDVTFLGHN